MLSYIQVQLIRFRQVNEDYVVLHIGPVDQISLYLYIIFLREISHIPFSQSRKTVERKVPFAQPKKEEEEKKKTMRNLAYTIPSSCLFLIPYDQSYSICNISHATSSRTLRMLFILLGVLRVGLVCAFGVWRLCFSFFFFFLLHAFVRLRLLFMYCSMNSSCKV